MSEKKAEQTAQREWIIARNTLTGGLEVLPVAWQATQDDPYDVTWRVREVISDKTTSYRLSGVEMPPRDFEVGTISPGIPYTTFTKQQLEKILQAPPPVKVQRWDFSWQHQRMLSSTVGDYVLYEDIKHLLGEES